MTKEDLIKLGLDEATATKIAAASTEAAICFIANRQALADLKRP